MKPLRLLLPAALVMQLLLAVGCPDTGIICNSPDTQCGEGCNNLTIDPSHCGGCGIACSTGFVCQNSACICDPSLGFVTCGQSCVDIRTNHANCGGCGNACPADQLCAAVDGGSTCVSDCMPGQSACSGSCVDMTSDAQNCGGCGLACVQGTGCVNGTCLPGLVVACFNSGQLYEVDPLGEVVGAVAQEAPVYSPIGLAFRGPDQVFEADIESNTLNGFGFNPNGTFDGGSSDGGDTIGMGAQSVTIKGDLAYVVDSTDHTLDIINLALPFGTDRLVCPANASCTASVVLPPNSWPQYVAVTDDAGLAFVTLQGNTELAPDAGDNPFGNRIAEIDLSTLSLLGDGGTYIPHDADAGYQPRPQGIAIVDGQIFVALANLNGYIPGGPGEVDVFTLFDGGPASLGLVQQDIELGGNCVNAGAVYPLNGILFVACGPQYNPTFTYVLRPGALAGLRIAGLVEAFAAEPFACPDGGGCSPGGALRMAYAGGKLFIGDSIDGRLFTADPTTGAILRGPSNALQVCPVNDGGYNFISDVVAP